MNESDFLPTLTAYLAGELELEPVAQAFAAAYHRDGWAMSLDLTSPDATPAAQARAAALWSRYAALTTIGEPERARSDGRGP